jgi:hypothetical protein
MGASELDALRSIVEEMGLERVFGRGELLAGKLAEFSDAYRESAASLPSEFPRTVSVADVIRDYKENPTRVRALIQAVAFMCSPRMLAMMWMVELGATIDEATLEYRSKERCVLRVAVSLGYSQNRVEFKSDIVWDVAVFRFIGISQADGSPYLDGFYPMRMRPA